MFLIQHTSSTDLSSTSNCILYDPTDSLDKRINNADSLLGSGYHFALHRILVYIKSEMTPACRHLAAAESRRIVGQVVILAGSSLRGYKFGGQNTEFDHRHYSPGLIQTTKFYYVGWKWV